jgi:hypothetical protein
MIDYLPHDYLLITDSSYTTIPQIRLSRSIECGLLKDDEQARTCHNRDL